MSTENTTVVATETTTSSSTSEKNLVLLRSIDGESFQVEKKVAIHALAIKKILDEGSDIPILDENGEILKKVIEYCKRHVEAKVDDDNELKAFDKVFVDVEESVLWDLFHAASHMHIPQLLDLVCKRFADWIQERTPDMIRSTFNLKKDATPEEEAEARWDFWDSE